MPQNKQERLYISIKEACEILQVSRPTFDKIRKEKKLLELSSAGTRYRFLRAEIENLAKTTRKTFTVPLTADQEKIDLTVFSEDEISSIKTSKTVFDFRRIRMFDPFGVLSLFYTILQLANVGKKIRLELEDNFICNHLKNLGFFEMLERENKENIIYDSSILKTNYDDYLYPIGLTKISMRKQEVSVVEKIINLLRAQGFSDAIGGYIGWIMGELVDNAMTHLVLNGFPSNCYLLAQRYKFTDSHSQCLIIGVADMGPGIHATLKKNPKYKDLTDAQAFLTAFKPKVSSWSDEYNRGKGLTDIVGIAMGNQSVLRVKSGNMEFQTDFRNQTTKLGLSAQVAGSIATSGTRFALVLIDKDFEIKSKPDVSEFIDRRLAEL
ncbi:MAG: helix-turn-helix domain-containing protein [Desulfobacteraceae bacterium]|nr:helix-turn-helix domain-containing protein [Desulfobacteraceae bacterium]